MRMTKLTALCLALCLLAGMLPTAMAEGENTEAYIVEDGILSAQVEQAVEELEGDLPAPSESAGGEEALEGARSDLAVSAPEAGYSYARTTSADAPLYFDAATGELITRLVKGEVVLITGDCDGFATVAVNAGGAVVEGFMDAADLAVLSESERLAYLDAAASGSVALYADDLGWPLAPLSAASRSRMAVMANYTEYTNDTVFKINGKEVYANQVPDTGSGNCWRWSQNMYKIIWGVNFNEKFEGTAATGLNLLRDLGDGDRLLTPEHLKYFVQNTQPGATIRVCACSSECPQFENDGLRCGHNGHSLVIVDKTEDGVITMDSHSNSQHTRFYSWQGFCNSWKNYTYVKYIKWPNAPALSPSNAIDGYSVSDFRETYRARATADGAGVYSKPSGGKVVVKLAAAETFTATKKAVKTVDGLTWVYGYTANGTTGWLALDGNVASSSEKIAVTGVALGQSKLLLLEGGTASLTAAVAPADASNSAVSWSSSNPAVIAVVNGSVTALATGTATVTVTTQEGGKTASCVVKAVPAQGTKNLSKKGSNGTVKMYLGQKLQLVPKFATKKGWKIKSAKSSKPKVASLDKTGVVTALSAGKTTITVTTRNKKKATLTVQVVDPFVPTKIALNKKSTVKLKKGATLQLYTKLTPSTAISALTWKSSKPKVADVDANGKVTAYRKGTCYIGVMTENGKLAKVKIKVS